MSAAQRNARVRYPGHSRLQVAVFAQIVDCHTMLPAESERGRGDRARAKDTDRFQVMDGNRQFPNVDGRFPIALLGRQAIGIDRHLDLKGEVIPADVAAGCQEIKRVLLDVHRNSISNLLISNFRSARVPRRRDGADGPAATCVANPSGTIWPYWFALPARVFSGSGAAAL